MIFPIDFKRMNDGKLFLLVGHCGYTNYNKRHVESADGEKDIVTWVTNQFFVSGTTGHTFVPFL